MRREQRFVKENESGNDASTTEETISNFFSLPGEVAIKKLMNALASNEKNGIRSKVQNDGEDNILVFSNTSYSQSEKRRHIPKRVVTENNDFKLECVIYKEFVNEIEKERINIESLLLRNKLKLK